MEAKPNYDLLRERCVRLSPNCLCPGCENFGHKESGCRCCYLAAREKIMVSTSKLGKGHPALGETGRCAIIYCGNFKPRKQEGEPKNDH